MNLENFSSANIGALGLIFDMFGAFWLAKSVIWRTKKQVELETTSFWDGNPYQKLSQEISKWYGWLGFILIFLGFGMQFCAQLFNFKVTWELTGIIVVLLLLSGLIFNKTIIKHYDKKVPREFRDLHGGLM